MSLLYDRLLFEKWKPLPRFAPHIPRYIWDHDVRQMAPALFSASVFKVDNVASYLKESGQKWEWYGEMPCAMPPFASSWFEFPAYLSHWVSSGIRRVGVLLVSSEVDPSTMPFPRDDAKTIVIASVFIEEGGSTYGPVVSVPIFLDTRGDVVSGGFEDRKDFAYSAVSNTYSADVSFPEDDLDMLRQMGAAVYCALFSCSLLNCKNVAVRQSNPPARLSKAHAKRRGSPLVTFKTLEIEPMKAVLRADGKSAEVGLARALHICRGHFATYEEGKGLFGKYTGRFWIPNHVRGNRENGVVVKDYSLKAPKVAV
jgi:hypothetical protein